MPWALVKSDEGAGVETQRRWLDFRERLIKLDETSIDAGRRDADEEDVARCVDALEAALDALVAAVPAAAR
jgi:cytidylate kinase|tara:strand:+ start:724 stop:936 length:213 start_codon:yes stop_codon:yes gene_type:complete